MHTAILYIFLVSCSSLSDSPDRSINVRAELKELAKYLKSDVITIYNQKATIAEKEAYRDEVILARIRAIDLRFNRFINEISDEEKELNIGTDSSVLGLSAAGTLSTVSSTQAIFSAISGIVTGVKTSFDENAFYNQTIVTLVAQMQADRTSVLADIYSGIKDDIGKYPLLRGLIDVENYFNAGTLLSAVNNLNNSVEKEQEDADTKMTAAINK